MIDINEQLSRRAYNRENPPVFDPLGEQSMGADPAGNASVAETIEQAKDIGQGALHGAAKGFEQFNKAIPGLSFVQDQFGKLFNFLGIDSSIDKPTTTVGAITGGLTQALVGILPGIKIAKKLIGTSRAIQRIGAEVVGGVFGDFYTSGNTEADGIIELLKMAGLDWTDALATSLEEFLAEGRDDPTEFRGRVISSAPGAIIGPLIEPLIELGAAALRSGVAKEVIDLVDELKRDDGGVAKAGEGGSENIPTGSGGPEIGDINLDADDGRALDTTVFDASEAGQDGAVTARELANPGETARAEMLAAEPKPIIVEAIDPELEKEAARAVTEPGAFGSGGAGTTGGATGARVSTTGQYVGAPKGTSTPQALGALRRKIKKTTLTGEPGRFWYERSSKQILDAVGGDKVEADKFAQLLAIYSQGTGVKANFTAALQAFNQAKAGIPIAAGRFSPSQAIRAQKVMDGIDWPGRKTNNFYNNLMVHIDPTRAQGVTADIWIARAFGFKNPDGTPFGMKQKDGKAGLTTPTDAQYDFIEKELKRIADDLGWEPQQVQAAMWVAQKASDEGTSLAAAGFDFADALQNSLGQVSWESIPGKTSGHLGEMFSAPYAQQVEYHQAISKAFLDDDGRDIIAKRLGILSPNDFEAPGFFEGKVSPGTQTNVAIPTKFKDTSPTGIDEGAELLVSAYSAVRGILMKQDGVGWHRPFFGVTKKGSNGIEVTVGRPLSETETVQLSQLIAEEAGHKGYNPIGSKNGIRLINFDHLNVDNKEFQAIINRALDRMEFDGGDEYVAELFGSKNGYHDNNWSVLKNGEGYLEGSLEGQPDLQRRVLDIVRELAPRIDTVDDDFIRRYGWTANTDLNATFRGVGQ